MVDEGVYELKRPQSAAIIERLNPAFLTLERAIPNNYIKAQQSDVTLNMKGAVLNVCFPRSQCKR